MVVMALVSHKIVTAQASTRPSLRACIQRAEFRDLAEHPALDVARTSGMRLCHFVVFPCLSMSFPVSRLPFVMFCILAAFAAMYIIRYCSNMHYMS